MRMILIEPVNLVMQIVRLALAQQQMIVNLARLRYISSSHLPALAHAHLIHLVLDLPAINATQIVPLVQGPLLQNVNLVTLLIFCNHLNVWPIVLYQNMENNQQGLANLVIAFVGLALGTWFLSVYHASVISFIKQVLRLVSLHVPQNIMWITVLKHALLVTVLAKLVITEQINAHHVVDQGTYRAIKELVKQLVIKIILRFLRVINADNVMCDVKDVHPLLPTHVQYVEMENSFWRQVLAVMYVHLSSLQILLLNVESAKEHARLAMGRELIIALIAIMIDFYTITDVLLPVQVNSLVILRIASAKVRLTNFWIAIYQILACHAFCQ